MIGSWLWSHAPALVVALPLLGAFLCPLLGGERRDGARRLWVALMMALTAAAGLALAARVFDTGTLVYAFGAAASDLTAPPDAGGIPIRIIFVVDAMSALMVVIIALLTLAAMLYSLSAEARLSAPQQFYALVFLMVAGMLGMVCTGDLFTFFVFLELASLAGAALVAFRIEKGVAVEAALKYALISTVGALSVLVAVGLLYGQYNALNLAQLASVLRGTTLDRVALALLVVPLAMKCGAVPMHFWTPDAYASAPSSVTALLVVSSQASLYALLRVLFTLYGPVADVAFFGGLLVTLGMLSLFVGVTMAIPQKDIKRLMAYHAVSQTGYMLLGTGVGLALLGNLARLDAFGRTALEGGLFHILNHALYKGLLFLTAGAVIHRLGTRQLNAMGGLGHTMPVTMACFGVGALAIAGIPPFNGFASKIMLYESVFRFHPVLAIVAMLVSILTLASFVKVFHAVFMGPRPPDLAAVQEVPGPMRAAMVGLAALVIVFGCLPGRVVGAVIAPAAAALLDRAGYVAAVLGGG